MKRFTFVTQSLNKLAEAERILGGKLEHGELELPEIQAVEVEKVVIHKAAYAYQALGGKPVLIEDTGLYIAGWNGLPGALVKWFIERVGTEGICQMMRAFPDRRAWAESIVAIHDGEVRTFHGRVEGTIALAPAGEIGFGWDPIFIPNGAEKTFGEMPPSEKDRYSMRRLAFEAMAAAYPQQAP